MRTLSALCGRQVFIMHVQAVCKVAFLATSGHVFAWIKIRRIFALDNGTPCWGSRTERRNSPERPRTRPPHQYLVYAVTGAGGRRHVAVSAVFVVFLLSRGNKNYSRSTRKREEFWHTANVYSVEISICIPTCVSI